MATRKHLNLFDLQRLADENNNLGLINKLIEYGILPSNVHCVRGHSMGLEKDNSVIDNYKWKCRAKFTERKQKAKPCNYR